VSTDTPARLGLSRRRQVGLFVAVTTVVVAIQWWYGNRHHFFDLGIYRDAMMWWSGGRPLYLYRIPDSTMQELSFTYPPFAAILLRPLAYLTPLQTVWVYSLISIPMYLVTMWWLVRPLADRHGWPRWLAFGLATVLASGAEPIRETYTLGQINFLLWLLIVLDLVVLNRRKSRFLGVGIGLATAIKLVPGIFVVYLLITRRWRAALVSVAAFAGATLVGAIVAPHDSWVFFTDKMIRADGVGQISYAFNQSIMGLLARLAPTGAADPRLWVLFSLPILAYGMWRARLAALVGDEYTGMAITGLAGSLISPLTWSHHIFWFVPALLVLADSALPPRDVSGPIISGVRGPRWVMWSTVAAYLSVSLTMLSWWQFTWHQPGGVFAFVLSNWLIWVMIVMMVFLPIRNTATTAVPPTTAAAAPHLDERPVAKDRVAAAAESHVAVSTYGAGAVPLFQGGTGRSAGSNS
jgi:alpha-1,2-mannosyltransferase